MIDPQALGLEITQIVGDEAYCKCPYHDDTRQSAEFNVEKGVFYCFGCHTSKTAEQLADDLGGEVVGTVSIQLSEEFGTEKDWLPFLRSRPAFSSEYLERREVTRWQISKHQIKMTERHVVFPLADEWGEITGVQIRATDGSEPKYKILGQKNTFWNEREIYQGGDVFIVEGVFGALRGELAGFRTAAILGSGSAAAAAEFLSRSIVYESCEDLYQYQILRTRPYAIMDPDYAGLLAAAKFVTWGIPVILTDDAPDDLTVTAWSHYCNNPQKFATLNIYDVISKSDQPERLEKAARKYWDKVKEI